MVIYNKYIPPKGYSAMAIWPFIFVRGTKVSTNTLRHEEIHHRQQKELLLIPFYLIYGIFHLIYGYSNNPFELEANYGENKSTYLSKRKLFSWFKYIW